MDEAPSNPFANLEVKPGDLVGGRYEIIRLLGAGGMGSVFEAKHTLLGRVVAIKVLRPEIALHPTFAGRFLQEAKAAAELSHKHIVQLTDYGLDGERPYMVMEYLHGESFGAMLKREGRLSPERVVAVMDPVLRALTFAHERGVIHRDIKPDNIFLARDDEGEVTPKIVDFGIAKRQDESVQLTSAGAALGTPAYMSPEQVMASKNVTPAADQYAVGTTIFEALTGENPFVADTLNAFIIAKATQTPRDLHALRPDLEPEFCAVVMRTLARAPEDRFPTLTALREALASWRGATLQGTTGVGPSTPGAPTAQQLRSDAVSRDIVPLAPAQQTLPNGTPATTPMALAATALSLTHGDVAAPRDHRMMFLSLGAVVLVAVAAIAAVTLSRPSTPPVAPPVQAQTPPPPPSAGPGRVVFAVQATPANAVILLDGEVVGTGRAEVVRPRDGERHQLEIRAAGFATMSEVLVASQDVHVSRVLLAAVPGMPRPAGAAHPPSVVQAPAAHGSPRLEPSAAQRPAVAATPERPTAPEPRVETSERPTVAAAPERPAAAPERPAATPERPAATPTPPRTNHANIDTTNPF
jgi:hypothetical protein